MKRIACIFCIVACNTVLVAQSSEDFISCIKNGDTEKVRLLIDSGWDVNATCKHGHLPLYYAISQKNLKMMGLLIRKGADVNKKSIYGDRTSLFYAVLNDSIPVTELLLKNGAEINAKDEHGRTPLIFALEQNCSQTTVCHLIKSGANVNVIDKYGKTAIFAAINHSIEMCSVLINAGADFSFHEKNSHLSILKAGPEEGLPLDKFKFIAENSTNVNFSDENGYSFLHSAIGYDDLSLVKQIVEKGGNVNAQNSMGETPLHLSVIEAFIGDPQVDIAAFLIKSGADIEIKDNQGKTAFDLATEWKLNNILEVFDKFR